MLKEILDKLTDEECQMIRAAINQFGSGEHPAADKRTLPFFTIGYTTYCLGRQLQAMKNVDEEKFKVIQTAHNKLLNKLLDS